MKQLLKERFQNSIDRNITDLIEYYEANLYEFTELTGLRNEIINCLLLELYQASIFTTNHFLERLIKIALIKNHTIGFNYSQPEDYNKKIDESKKLYDSLILSESLKQALKQSLITQDEFTLLTTLRKEMRNPYSHAEVAKINEHNPKIFTGFMFNLEDVKTKLMNNEPLIVPSPTHIDTFSPTFAQLYQDQNAKELAFNYFKSIHQFLIKIEQRFKLKRQAFP